METEIGVMQPQAKNIWIHQKLQVARRDPPLEPSEGAQPCRHLDRGLLGSKTSVVLSCPVYVNFLSRKPIWCENGRSDRIAVTLPQSTFSQGERNLTVGMPGRYHFDRGTKVNLARNATLPQEGPPARCCWSQ